MGEGIPGRTFAQMKPLIVNDYPAWDNATLGGMSAGLYGLLSVPLIRSGTPLGVLLIRSYDPATRFTDDDLRLLTLFGDQAAAAFVTAEAFERQRRAVEELERLNKAKSDFVTVVSHEFCTPLTGIRGFSEMMCDEDFSIEEMKEFAADINRETQRLHPAHQRDVGPRAHGIRPHAPEPGAGRPQRHHRRSGRAHPSHGPRPLAAAGPGRPVAAPNWRPRQARAGRHQPDQQCGQVFAAGGEIAIRTRVDGDVAHVGVQDHGMGIPAEALETVFERYARIESGAGRLIQGTGLGPPDRAPDRGVARGPGVGDEHAGPGSVFQFTLPLGVAPVGHSPES